MPTYEYKCNACGHTFEKFQSITADPVKKCPQCGKLKVKRLISAGAGLLFKGSGFYETDYRSSSYQSGAKADKEASSKAAKSDTKDTKSSAKADSSSKKGSSSQSA